MRGGKGNPGPEKGRKCRRSPQGQGGRWGGGKLLVFLFVRGTSHARRKNCRIGRATGGRQGNSCNFKDIRGLGEKLQTNEEKSIWEEKESLNRLSRRKKEKRGVPKKKKKNSRIYVRGEMIRTGSRDIGVRERQREVSPNQLVI